MSKDVILDKYARLYEIPNQLALLGHHVECFCLSYQSHSEGRWDESNESKTLVWHSKSYKGVKKVGLITYPILLLQRLKKIQPDVIVAASDIPHIAWGAWCARKLNIPFVADLYDNFEGFGQAKILGMKTLLRKAVCRADLITTTSQPLAELVKHAYGAQGKVISMPSTVDTKIFVSNNKSEAKKLLGLQSDCIYIGTAGGLYRDKGVDVIYQAWKIIEKHMPNVHLVIAGPYNDNCPPPEGERVHYLGSLTHSKIAMLFQALDVGIISILDTPFGRYCFPQKAYEMLACQLPVVVANVGEMNYLFKQTPQSLFEAGNAQDLANKLMKQIQSPVQNHVFIEDWTGVIQQIEPHISSLKESFRLS
ncbi:MULTISPECIES: glycosyltransferase family 4 protein [Acinetobacter]|jgi:teichuronic acid biosynthesis glycosyltransferase TuaC|nr:MULTISPECIES: glycosyltransferase family 4 protein [Acinetobacter]MCW8038279.1 glycosyltransferase family 4 protein [Acinetobacter entericus]